MKWFMQLARHLLAKDSDHHSDARYERAVKLADEVTEKVRERGKIAHPFRSVVSELISRGAVSNPRLIADAYEALQESRIFLGPPNGGH